MGQRIHKKVQAPEGVAPGQTALVKFATGSKYHDIQLVTNMSLANMGEIRLIANNKTIHRYSAEERDAINQFYGLEAFDGILMIPLDRKALKTRRMEEITGLNTGVRGEDGEKISALYLEIDIASDATAPTLDVYATTSAATDDGVGTVMHVTKHTRNAAGSGELEISDLPFNSQTAAAINSVFVFPSAGEISKMIVERGLFKVVERTKALNEFMQKNGERNPQAGMQAIDFTENAYGENALDLRGYQDYRYRFTMTDAATLPIVSEYLGVLGD